MTFLPGVVEQNLPLRDSQARSTPGDCDWMGPTVWVRLYERQAGRHTDNATGWYPGTRDVMTGALFFTLLFPAGFSNFIYHHGCMEKN